MSTIVEQVTKRSESKKRHTKLCRFYQTRQCPFSAEECDFIHSSADEHPPPPIAYRRKDCRYFKSGNCTQGLWCRFTHSLEDSNEQRPSQGGDSSDVENEPVRIIHTETPHNSKRGLLDVSGIITSEPRIRTQTPSIPISPVYLPWPPYADSVHSPGIRQDMEDFQANLTSPTGTTSSSDTTADTSESSNPGADAAWVAKAHMGHSPTTPPDNISSFFAAHTMIPVPAVFGPPPSSYFGFYPPRPSKSPSRSARSRSHSRPGSSRQKATYKTKPCKFYNPESICPKGDQCTFIHDPKVMEMALPGSPVRGGGRSPETRSDSTPSSRSSPTQKLQHELPTKPLSVQEENKKKGFFPISWRVIGGGVKIGRPSPGQEEAASPHSKSSNGADKDPGSPLNVETSFVAESENEQAGDKRAVDLPDGTVPFPGTVEQEGNEEEKVGVKGTPRARAVSIPTTPTAERMDIISLFSAESPGGL